MDSWKSILTRLLFKSLESTFKKLFRILVISVVCILIAEINSALKNSCTVTVSDSSLFNLREMLDGAEIVIGDPALIGPHWYNMPPSVKWIQSTWAGVDYLCKNFVTPSKVCAFCV